MGAGIDTNEAQVLLEAEVGSLRRKPRKRSVKYLDGAKEVGTDFTRPGMVKVLYETGDTYEGGVKVTPTSTSAEEEEKENESENQNHILARNGKGVYLWKGNKAQYEGDYKRNRKNGNGRYRASNGDVYVGGFVNGRKSGNGVYTYASGDKYIGTWLDGQRHGKGTFVYADGGRELVTFAHGERIQDDAEHEQAVPPRRSATFRKRKHNPVGLVLAGRPATGKSTQAERIAGVLGLVHVDVEELVETAATTRMSWLERQIASCLDEGDDIPDELLVRLVFERLKKKDVRTKGFILVDFPKTVAQARLLEDEGVVVDRFIHLTVSNADMHDRVNGRVHDPKTGKVYHLAFNPPPPELLDSVVPLRKDAKGELIARLEHHENNIDSVLEHYRGKAVELDASAQEEGVLADIREVLYHNKAPLGIIIAGPPGAGKGTQSANIREKHGLVHLSSGDLLRAEIKNGTEEGKTAKKFMDAGELVPADLVVGIIKNRLAEEDVQKNGFLLDGFPRQLEEAEALLEMGVNIDLYLVLDVPQEKLIERVLGRQVDGETGDTYHEKYNPAPAHVRARLKTRVDDTVEKMQRRLRIFHANVEPIKAFFGERVDVVNGDAHIEQVSDEVEGTVRRAVWRKIKEGDEEE